MSPIPCHRSKACSPAIARKTVLVEHGSTPSALDNRPLNFKEFQALQNQTLYISATPAKREIEWAKASGRTDCSANELVDRNHHQAARGQIDDLIEEARKRVDLGERVLVTTLTKRTAEELTIILRKLV